MNFLNAPMMRCRYCHFPGGLVKTYWRTNIYWRYSLSTEFLCGPRCVLLVHCVNPYWPIVLALMYFSKLLKGHSRPRRNSKIWLQHSNMASLFIEIYWSVCETIIKWYWRVIIWDFEDLSNNNYFSQMFHFNHVENCKKFSSTKTHFKSSKASCPTWT